MMAAAAACGRLLGPGRQRAGPAAASLLWSTVRSERCQSTSLQQGIIAKTSLSSPPWPEVKLPDPTEEAKFHAEVVQKVNEMIATGRYGRLFAVVHFASKQWKVTSEDLILMENVLPAECGDRIRLEKVLLVGADDFTLIGKPLLGYRAATDGPPDKHHRNCSLLVMTDCWSSRARFIFTALGSMEIKNSCHWKVLGFLLLAIMETYFYFFNKHCLLKYYFNFNDVCL
ncbi:large ribosomal subunit protein bL21m isoform X1 [Lepidochelys kempii]|uniref:large ribosomal subunit protein bL21m isoform X1 n=1 Tax=Lepidochelys kempii TaxID=8472 RepID=UPI003C700DB1